MQETLILKRTSPVLIMLWTWSFRNMKALRTAISHQRCHCHCHCLTILWLDQLSAVGIAGDNLSAPFPIIAGRQKFVLRPTTSYDCQELKQIPGHHLIIVYHILFSVNGRFHAMLGPLVVKSWEVDASKSLWAWAQLYGRWWWGWTLDSGEAVSSVPLPLPVVVNTIRWVV